MSADLFSAKCDATVRSLGVDGRMTITVFDIPTVLFEPLPGDLYALGDGVRGKTHDADGVALRFFEVLVKP